MLSGSCLLLAVLWLIWMERISRMFGYKRQDVCFLYERVKYLASLCVDKDFKDFSSS